MKRDCNTCVYKEGSCYPSTMIFDKDKTCKSYVPDYEDYIAELEKKIENIRNYLAYNIPHELINEATNKIWHMI